MLELAVGTDLAHIVGKSVVAEGHQALGNVDLRLSCYGAGTIAGRVGASLSNAEATGNVDFVVSVSIGVYSSISTLWYGKAGRPRSKKKNGWEKEPWARQR